MRDERKNVQRKTWRETPPQHEVGETFIIRKISQHAPHKKNV